jgi:hypothetical protein
MVFGRDRRLPLMVLFLILLSFALSSVPRVAEAADHDVITEYYSDDTYTDLIGERIIFCDGTRFAWGTTSVYRITYTVPCGTGGARFLAPLKSL